MKLTIYVPAYRRPHTLARLLDSIPQHPDVRVVVSDDDADGPGIVVRPGCEYEQRSYRIGRDANVLRALAVCDSEWLWVIGDDDWLLPGALDEVLTRLDEDTDRLILWTREAAPYISARGMHGLDTEIIGKVDPALLIATTCCTANVYRMDTLDLAEGMRHYDTEYSYAFSTLGARRWQIASEPLIGVGTEPSPPIPKLIEYLDAYLSALCDTAGVARIGIREALHWNFVSLARNAGQARLSA